MIVKSLEDLPEALRSQFQEITLDDGTKAYQDNDSLELKQHLYNIKTENKGLKESRSELDAKLKEFESTQAAAIESARTAALEEARSKGDVKAIEERYQQQMADLEKRVREEERNSVTKEFNEQRAGEKARGLAAKLAARHAVDDASQTALEALLSPLIKFDAENDKHVFYDTSGGATSLDSAGFEQELAKMPHLQRLIKAQATASGGGLANGSGVGGASQDAINEKAAAAKKKGDVAGFLRANFEV